MGQAAYQVIQSFHKHFLKIRKSTISHLQKRKPRLREPRRSPEKQQKTTPSTCYIILQLISIYPINILHRIKNSHTQIRTLSCSFIFSSQCRKNRRTALITHDLPKSRIFTLFRVQSVIKQIASRV